MCNKAKSVIVSIITITALCLTSISPPQNTVYADNEKRDLSAIKIPAKGNAKLDSHLNKVISVRASQKSAPFPELNRIETTEDRERVIVECSQEQMNATVSAISPMAEVEAVYGNLVQVSVPVSNIISLSELPGVRFVRQPYQAFADTITSEGVSLINADDWQTDGYTGTGVKIAILDLGFSGYTARQSSGELPASLTTHWAPSLGGPGTEIHGTACAEIVYDIAPGAQLYLVNFVTEVEFGNAVDWLIAQGVNIISHSMAWLLGGPGNGTGPICQIVDRARAAGILWVNSAGNYAQQHWMGNFTDADSDKWNEFSTGDGLNTISAINGDVITVALTWNDTWGASSNDYDLYLVNNSLVIVDGSEVEQNGDDDPAEGLSYTATYTGSYYIAIHAYNNPAQRNLNLFSANHTLEYQTASGSLSVPADSSNALAVGAVPWNSPSSLEPFSSQGPTKDGRAKPDLVAPDGVSTEAYGTGAFYGTSAAAPCVAGAVALVKQRYTEYTPAQVQSFLESRAVDLGSAGKDNLYGSGRLNLGLASDKPVVVTNDATNVTNTSARLNASLTLLGMANSVDVSFQWGTTSGNYPNETTLQSRNNPGSVYTYLSSLTNSTVYYYRVKAVGNGTSYGEEKSFTTSSMDDLVGAIAFSSKRDGNFEIYKMDANGNNQTRLTNNSFEDRYPIWSPDGTKIAFTSNRDGNKEIYVMDFDGSDQMRLTNNDVNDSDPTWSPDGTKLAYVSVVNSHAQIFRMNSDGSSKTQLTNDNYHNLEPNWSPDGNKIVFQSIGRGTYAQIYTMNINGTNQICITDNLTHYHYPKWSPDGSKVAYSAIWGTDEGSVWSQIYTMRADGSDKVSINQRTDGQSLCWSPNGTKIAYGTSNESDKSEVFTLNVDGSNVVRLTYNTSVDLEPSWTTSIDTTPPSAVTNLACSNPASTSVTLTWTSPGDDGSTSTATQYDIRYSTSTINEGNWASATQATGEPAPLVAGSSQTFTVSGLNPVTTYYFALKTSDEIPNWSSISNCPSGTTASSSLTGWDNHLTLTIDHTKVTSDLTHFPVLIHLSPDCGINSADMTRVFDEVGASSQKIAVTTSDGSTQLYVEVEKWDAANHEAWLWVSKSGWTISSTADTDLYLYYDNTHADNTSYVGVPGSTAAQNVWDSNFVLVDLMGEGTDSSHTMDSTSHSNNGTKYEANGPSQSEGIAGNAQDFDGSNDYIGYGIGNILPTGTNPFTIIFWANPASMADGSYHVFAKLKQDTEFFIGANNIDILNRTALYASFRNAKYWRGSTEQSSVANTWNQYAVKYLGGDKNSISNYAAFINSSAETLTQGGYAGGNTNANIAGSDGVAGIYDGKLDYFSISSTARSDAWIKATYYTAADNLLSFGASSVSGWANNTKLTIDHTKVTSDLTHFPVLIHLSPDCGINSADMTAVFDEVGTNSQKIAVTQSDGTTQLYVEVEKWDAANHEAWLWVSKSGWTISSTADTDLYLYYDNTHADNTTYVGVPGTTAAKSVWDSSFAGVYHMADGADNAHIYDSSANGNNGTKKGAGEPVEATGVSGNVLDFDGTDDFIDVSGVVSGELFDGATTLEAWAALDSWSSYQVIVAAGKSGDTSPVVEIFYNYSTAKFVAYASQGAVANSIASSNGYSGDATRHYFTMTVNASGHITVFSIDGVSQGNATANTISLAGATKFYIGQLPYSFSPCNPYGGKMDEVRVSGENRSDAWIKATYYTAADNLLSFPTS